MANGQRLLGICDSLVYTWPYSSDSMICCLPQTSFLLEYYNLLSFEFTNILQYVVQVLHIYSQCKIISGIYLWWADYTNL